MEFWSDGASLPTLPSTPLLHHSITPPNLMPIDPETFKEALSRWASGVTVVTSRREDGGVHGMTASSFTSVSLNPPLVLICVDRRHRTHDCIHAEGCFGVHILADGMEELSDRCAGFLGEHGHWLDDLPHRRERTGAPILDGTLCWLDCALWQAYDGGDHTIFVGEVQAAGAAEGEPLLWFERGYHTLPNPEAGADTQD